MCHASTTMGSLIIAVIITQEVWHPPLLFSFLCVICLYSKVHQLDKIQAIN